MKHFTLLLTLFFVISLSGCDDQGINLNQITTQEITTEPADIEAVELAMIDVKGVVGFVQTKTRIYVARDASATILAYDRSGTAQTADNQTLSRLGITGTTIGSMTYDGTYFYINANGMIYRRHSDWTASSSGSGGGAGDIAWYYNRVWKIDLTSNGLTVNDIYAYGGSNTTITLYEEDGTTRVQDVNDGGETGLTFDNNGKIYILRQKDFSTRTLERYSATGIREATDLWTLNSGTWRDAYSLDYRDGKIYIGRSTGLLTFTPESTETDQNRVINFNITITLM